MNCQPSVITSQTEADTGLRPTETANKPTAPVVFELLGAAQAIQNWAEQWEQLRSANTRYRSPFFAAAFTENLAKCTDNIQVAIARQEVTLLAVLPVQVDARQRARPAGLGINDAHGILISDAKPIATTALLSGCGLQNYAFHASPPDLADSQTYQISRSRSFLADLTATPEGYEHFLRSSSTTIDRQGQKTRRLIRELGPLRFEFDCTDTKLLDKLIDWKRDQYQRTHTYDILGVAWIQQLLHTLHAAPRNGLHGLLNVLFMGETPVAMHYGMRDGDFLHYWFPVFDSAYSVGSPGTQLFLEVVRECERLGIRAIDMGYGEQRYKYKLTNVITEMSNGLIDPSPLRRSMYRRTNSLRAKLKQMPIKDTVKPWVRKLFPSFGKGTYEV